MKLMEAFSYWLSAAERTFNTQTRYRAVVTRLTKGGLVEVGDVTRERVIEIQRAMLSRGMMPSAIRTEIAGLRAILAQLEEHGLFPTGTLAEIRKVAVQPPKQARRHRVRFCTRAEVAHLAETAARVEPRMELPILVAAWAGPRISELGRMKAEDRQGGHFYIETLPEWGEAGTCKTGPRTVPVCRELAKLFAERLPQHGWLFPANSQKGLKHGRNSRTPFMSRRVLERGIKHVRRAAGLPEDITFTTMRHTRASWWLQGGASIYKVADWMGHSVAVCERFYGALLDGYDPDCEKAPAA